MLSRLARSLAHSSKNVARSVEKVRIGPTIKERLLGPSNGKPFLYGSMAVAGTSALGVGALAYYGLGLSKDGSKKGWRYLQESGMWPEYVRDRVWSTYGYLGKSLGVATASAHVAGRSRALLKLALRDKHMAVVSGLAAIFVTGNVTRWMFCNRKAKHAAWLLHAGVLGAALSVLAPLCSLGGPVLVRAAWYTAGIVAGLSAVATTAPSNEILLRAGPLSIGLGAVFVANVGHFFLPSGPALGAGVTSMALYGGLLLFSAYLLYDTQRIVAETIITPPDWECEDGYGIMNFDPINAQISIYMWPLNYLIFREMIGGTFENTK